RTLESLLAARGVDGALAAPDEWPVPLRDPLVRDLVAAAREVLRRDPGQLATQLAGRLDPHDTEHAALRRALTGLPGRRPGLRLLSASLEPPGSPLVGAVAVHEALVHAVVVLPDGDTCVTAGEDGGPLGVLSLSTLEVVHRLPGHAGPVMAVAVSADGRVAASSSMDNAVLVWDLDAGTLAFPLYDTQSRTVTLPGDLYLTAPG